MEMKDRLHEQISNATSRLAKLQARQFLAAQRQATKDRAAVRRYDRLRRKRLAELVIAAGCEQLEDAQILNALLRYRHGLLADDLSLPVLVEQALINTPRSVEREH